MPLELHNCQSAERKVWLDSLHLTTKDCQRVLTEKINKSKKNELKKLAFWYYAVFQHFMQVKCYLLSNSA